MIVGWKVGELEDHVECSLIFGGHEIVCATSLKAMIEFAYFTIQAAKGAAMIQKSIQARLQQPVDTYALIKDVEKMLKEG